MTELFYFAERAVKSADDSSGAENTGQTEEELVCVRHATEGATVGKFFRPVGRI